jgi:hypothetical protein
MAKKKYSKLSNTLFILGWVAVILVVIIFFVFKDDPFSVADDPGANLQVSFKLKDLNLENLDRLEINQAKKNNQIKLFKENETWFIQEKKAGSQNFSEPKEIDLSKLAGVLTSLSEAELTQRVASKEESHARLAVDEKTGTQVDFFSSGQRINSLVFGKTTREGGIYVRKADQTEVYKLNAPIIQFNSLSLQTWEKKEENKAKQEEDSLETPSNNSINLSQ